MRQQHRRVLKSTPLPQPKLWDSKAAEKADQRKLTLDFYNSSAGLLDRALDDPLDQVKALKWQLDRAYKHLKRLANTDPRAAEAMAEVAIEACRNIGLIESKWPSAVRSVARRNIVWPVLKSPLACFDETNETPDPAHMKILDRLEVGRDFAIQGQKWNPHDELSVLTNSLFQAVHAARANLAVLALAGRRERWFVRAQKLPPFSPDITIVKKWGEVLVELFRARHPSPSEVAKKFGHLVKAPTKQKGPGTVATEVRSRIKERLLAMAGLRKHL